MRKLLTALLAAFLLTATATLRAQEKGLGEEYELKKTFWGLCYVDDAEAIPYWQITYTEPDSAKSEVRKLTIGQLKNFMDRKEGDPVGVTGNANARVADYWRFNVKMINRPERLLIQGSKRIEDPKTGELQLENTVDTYWFIVYELHNNTGQAREVIPNVWIEIDELDIETKMPKRYYDIPDPSVRKRIGKLRKFEEMTLLDASDFITCDVEKLAEGAMTDEQRQFVEKNRALFEEHNKNAAANRFFRQGEKKYCVAIFRYVYKDKARIDGEAILDKNHEERQQDPKNFGPYINEIIKEWEGGPNNLKTSTVNRLENSVRLYEKYADKDYNKVDPNVDMLSFYIRGISSHIKLDTRGETRRDPVPFKYAVLEKQQADGMDTYVIKEAEGDVGSMPEDKLNPWRGRYQFDAGRFLAMFTYKMVFKIPGDEFNIDENDVIFDDHEWVWTDLVGNEVVFDKQ